MSRLPVKLHAKSKDPLYLFFIMLIAFAFIMGFFKISDYDTWWHLKTGELILSSGIPHTDPFSFTAAGKPWITHEWLAEVIFYLLYTLGGLTALIFFKALVSAVIAYILFDFAGKFDVAGPLAAAVSLFSAAGLSYMMYSRPHIFTYLFLAISCYFLFKESKSRKAFILERWLILPAIFWLWANMHAGFILGVAIYWLVALKEFLFPIDKYKSIAHKFINTLVPAILVTTVCMINPNGFSIFIYPFLISMTPAFKSTISEWVSPIYLGPDEWLAKAILIIASILGLLTVSLQMKRRPDIALIVLGIGISAWLAMRNIQNFLIVLSLGLFALGNFTFLKKLESRKIFRSMLPMACAVWMIACFALILNYQREKGRLGLGIEKGQVPIEAAEFLKATDFTGNIINVLSDGGYLIWAGYPRWKVFVDGRLDVYGPDQITEYRRLFDGSVDALTTLDKIRADAAVIPMPPKMGALRNQLAATRNWALVYFDDYYLVYLKREKVNQRIIDNHNYAVINPLRDGYGLSSQSDAPMFFAEAERTISERPNSGVANAVYAYALQQKGEYLKAALYYKKTLEIQPGVSQMYQMVANMYNAAGVQDSARAWYHLAANVFKH